MFSLFELPENSQPNVPETEEHRFSKVIFLIKNIFLMVFIGLNMYMVVIFFDSIKLLTSTTFDFSYINFTMLLIFYTSVVVFCLKTYQIAAICLASAFYSYVLVNKTELLSFLQNHKVLTDSTESWTKALILAVLTMVFTVWQYFILFITRIIRSREVKKIGNIPENRSIEGSQASERFQVIQGSTPMEESQAPERFQVIQEPQTIEEPYNQNAAQNMTNYEKFTGTKNILRFFSTKALIHFIFTNFCLLGIALLDLSVIYYFTLVGELSIFAKFLFSCQILLNSILFKFLIGYFNFKVCRSEHKRVYKITKNEENTAHSIILYQSHDRISSNQRQPQNNQPEEQMPNENIKETEKQKIGNILICFIKCVPLFILFPYSFIPGLPFHKKLRYIFRTGLNAAIIREILNNHDFELKNNYLDLEEYVILLIFINFYTLSILNECALPFFILLIFKRTAFLVLDSVDMCAVCGVAGKLNENI